MTIHSNDLRAAVDGALVTATNTAATGQETINDVLQPGSPGAVKFSVVGSVPYVLVTPPTDTSVGRFAYTGLNLTACATRVLWTPLDLPNVTEQIHQIRSASALVAVVTATAGTTPRFLLLDSTSTTLWTSSVTLTAGQEYRIEVNVPAISATTGQIQCKIYNGPGTGATLLDDSTLLTGKNLGAANVAVARWGMLNRASAQTSTGFRFRYPAYNDAAGFIGGTSGSAPTVSVGGDITTEPFATVTLSATASDPAGGTLTYAWTRQSNTSSSTPTLSSTSAVSPTYTAPGDWGVTGSQQTWRCTVTSSVTGLSASDDVIVAVKPATIGLVTSTGTVRALRARLM